jgi:thioredoxin reductase
MHDVLIIGGGVVGLQAAVLTAKANLDTLVLNGGEPLVCSTDKIQNLVTRRRISGEEIITTGRERVQSFGGDIIVDILLRVNAEESRAVGVSGLEAKSPDDQPFRARGVPQRRTGGLLAMPRGRYPYPRPCTASRCCFCHRDASRCLRTRG